MEASLPQVLPCAELFAREVSSGSPGGCHSHLALNLRIVFPFLL